MDLGGLPLRHELKSLRYMTFLTFTRCEFLRIFREFAAREATAPFAQRRIFCGSQAFATARLGCAFAVVRQSLAEPAIFLGKQAEHANERPLTLTPIIALWARGPRARRVTR